jgi:hypothetical protein
MYAVRRWSVRHARGLEAFYNGFERVLLWLEPVIRRIGYDRLERPTAWLEEKTKGFLFDCQMCGQCALSHTGMSCPMNCPKQLRNGPCGGVRANGNCEVKPDMKCVWVEASNGSQKMKHGGDIRTVEIAVDRQLEGRSSWLRVVRMKTEEKRQARENGEQAV